MARITVEDCLKKVDSQYDLVLLAKERTSQLNAGNPPLVPRDNDKNTVIALREIGEGKISIKSLKESAINRLRKYQKETVGLEELDEENEDNFDKMYKGEISKIINIIKLNNSGTLSRGKTFLLVNLSTNNPEKNKVATVSIE